MAVGEVVCLIDTEAPKPGAGEAAKEESAKEVAEEGKQVTKASQEELSSEKKNEEKAAAPKASTSSQAKDKTYATGTPSPAAKKILEEKGMDSGSVSGTGRGGRITKEDAVKAKPSMGTPG